MLTIIRKLAILLLAVCLWASPIKADESLLPEPIPPSEISIAEISEVFVVDPNIPQADPDYVEARVRAYFHDIPIMIAIARCESKFQQFRSDGSLNVSEARDAETGRRISSATGVFQIASGCVVEGNPAK